MAKVSLETGPAASQRCRQGWGLGFTAPSSLFTQRVACPDFTPSSWQRCLDFTAPSGHKHHAVSASRRRAACSASTLGFTASSSLSHGESRVQRPWRRHHTGVSTSRRRAASVLVAHAHDSRLAEATSRTGSPVSTSRRRAAPANLPLARDLTALGSHLPPSRLYGVEQPLCAASTSRRRAGAGGAGRVSASRRRVATSLKCGAHLSFTAPSNLFVIRSYVSASRRRAARTRRASASRRRGATVRSPDLVSTSTASSDLFNEHQTSKRLDGLLDRVDHGRLGAGLLPADASVRQRWGLDGLDRIPPLRDPDGEQPATDTLDLLPLPHGADLVSNGDLPWLRPAHEYLVDVGFTAPNCFWLHRSGRDMSWLHGAERPLPQNETVSASQCRATSSQAVAGGVRRSQIHSSELLLHMPTPSLGFTASSSRCTTEVCPRFKARGGRMPRLHGVEQPLPSTTVAPASRRRAATSHTHDQSWLHGAKQPPLSQLRYAPTIQGSRWPLPSRARPEVSASRRRAASSKRDP